MHTARGAAGPRGRVRSRGGGASGCGVVTHFETSYYLGPQRESERAYAVLLEGLRRSGKAAVVRFVMATRQHHALIRATADALVLHTLHYADEVRPGEGAWTLPKPAAAEVELVTRFIDAPETEGFDPEKYRDEYRETLTELIRAKADGEPVVRSPCDPDGDPLLIEPAGGQPSPPWDHQEPGDRRLPAPG